ncbi:hypothetical protein C2E23DRAFT_860266 [Lenzites betulinus]|nr:hypothetical protein C2E23DRAFT_860266 [Lenzites betulinus]
MPDTMPTDSIPAPEEVALHVYDSQYTKLSLQSQMGLKRNRKLLNKMVDIARRAALQHLEGLHTPAYREQDPSTIATIVDQCRKWYTNAMELAKDDTLWDTLPDAGPSTAEIALQKDDLSRESPDIPLRHSLVCPSPEEKVGPTWLTSKCQADRNADLAASPEQTEDVDVVAHFLASLKIPAHDADQIAALFREMGIENEDYLAIFSTLETRDVWLHELYKSGNLSMIQLRLLKEGFGRLGRNVQ